MGSWLGLKKKSPPVANWAPSGWECDAAWYAAGDGCDCECGVAGALDPDCLDGGGGTNTTTEELYNCPGGADAFKCSAETGACVALNATAAGDEAPEGDATTRARRRQLAKASASVAKAVRNADVESPQSDGLADEIAGAEGDPGALLAGNLTACTLAVAVVVAIHVALHHLKLTARRRGALRVVVRSTASLTFLTTRPPQHRAAARVKADAHVLRPSHAG